MKKELKLYGINWDVGVVDGGMGGAAGIASGGLEAGANAVNGAVEGVGDLSNKMHADAKQATGSLFGVQNKAAMTPPPSKAMTQAVKPMSMPKLRAFTTMDDLHEDAKSAGNAAGGVVGGGIGAVGGGILGAGIGGALGHANTKNQVNKALTTANEAAGNINDAQAALDAKPRMKKADKVQYQSAIDANNKTLTELNAYGTNNPNNFQGTKIDSIKPTGGPATNPVTGGALSQSDAAFISKAGSPNASAAVNNAAHSKFGNLSNVAAENISKTAKSNVKIGGGKGALLGAGIGIAAGGMFGSEKGSSIFSDTDDELESRNYSVMSNATGFAKDLGKFVWQPNVRKKLAQDALMWGSAGAATSYVVDKAITRDARKNGIMPQKQNQPQRSYSVSQSVMNTIKKHQGTAFTLGLAAGIPSINTIAGYKGQKEALKQTVNASKPSQQQKSYSFVSGQKVKGILSEARKMVYDPELTHRIGGSLGRIGEKSNNPWTKKVASSLQNQNGRLKKLALGIGGASLGIGSMSVMGSLGEKAVRKPLQAIDKDAYAYEKQQNQQIQ